MALIHHKSMKKKIVFCFFLLFLLNSSLECSISSNSLPESQDDTRQWTLLNNENNIANIEVQDSRFVSIQYYIEEIEEIDHVRYIVNFNFTGDILLIYGNVSEDLVKFFTNFYVSVFAGDGTDFYYELKILNETIFSIPDYFYNFSWNFTSTKSLQFLDLRFHTMFQFSNEHSHRRKEWTLIEDSLVFKKDSFKNMTNKINFNLNSQQFITNFNISLDYSKENHSNINIVHNEINSGDASLLDTVIDGSMAFWNREQNLNDNDGWIQEFSYNYSRLYCINFPDHKICETSSQNPLVLTSNYEISEQADKFEISLGIKTHIKVESPLLLYGGGHYYYYSVSLSESLFYELDNISPLQEFFQRYSRIFNLAGIILGFSGLVILRNVYKRKRSYS